MSGTWIALIGFGGMLALIALRLHVGVAMFVTGCLGYIYLSSGSALFAFLKTNAYNLFASYTLSVIPLFILMGAIAEQSGLSSALFRAAAAFMGQVRGGLAMAVIAACTAFGAICGSSVAVYNLEQGSDQGHMLQFDRDAVAAIDIPAAEKAIAAGLAEAQNGVPIIDPEKAPGVLTLIPVPKNPHGINVTPDGRYAIASGKLSPTVSIIDVKTLKIVAEPEVGLGPLHTTFDDRGNAFTSLFLDSQVVKWNIDKAIAGDDDYIVDRINVHYNIGHLQAAGGETMKPYGDFLLALNKLSKDQYVPVGPDLPENQELIDISGEKMTMIGAFPTPPEPHDAVFVHASVLKPLVKQVFETGDEAVKPGQEQVVRTGPNSVRVDMTLIRSAFTPEKFEVREGDTVTLRITNVETIRDMTHGYALPDHDLNVSLPPGATRTVSYAVRKPGVYWFYCTNFCSALHLEMRGRMVVQPKDMQVSIPDWHANQNVKGITVPGVPSTGAGQ
jgi:nitrous-oxide reductase